jgi:hypothetical protein
MNNSTNPKQRNFVVGLIVIGLLIIVFFGLRTVRAFREFHELPPLPPFATKPVETDVNLIRDWMTLRYISLTYRVPLKLLYETLQVPPKGNERKSLKQLNNKYYPESPGIVIERVKAAILASQPAPTPPPPATAVPPLTPVPPVVP